MREEILWVEIYRPKTVEECILPASIKQTFQEYVNQKQIPNLMLAGSGGCGKCLDPDEEIEILISDEMYALLKLSGFPYTT